MGVTPKVEYETISKAEFYKIIGYDPHPKQWLYHNSDARFKVPCCGRRFGKSTMAAKDMELELFQPNKRFWIVGPTYDLAEKEFRVIWDDLLIGMNLIADRRIKKAYNKNQGEMYIEFPWRTRIECRSATHPDKLVGEGLHGVIMSEAAKHTWETFNRFIRPALADYNGWATFPTTPEGHNWLYTMWQQGQDGTFLDTESWQFPSWDNPRLYPLGRHDPEILNMERTMSFEEFQQEIAANFSAFVGKIYNEFSERDYVIDYEFNPAWPNYIAMDWGYTHPFAGIEFQVSPDDRVYIWREHYMSYKTLEEHMAIMGSRPQPEGYHLDLAFGDAASPESRDMVSRHMVPCYAEPEAKQDWRQGIELVKRFLKVRPDGKPGLFVDRSCTNTIREFNTYRTKERMTSTMKETNAIGPTNNKTNDDAMDAIRYGLMHVFVLGAGQYSLADFVYDANQARKSDPAIYNHPLLESSGEEGYFNMAEMESL